MSKVAVIGLFCKDKNVSDGQSVKTRIVTEEIERRLGQNSVKRIDTYEWKKNPLKLFCDCVLAVWRCENVIFMTDAGGIKIFPWLLRIANIFKSSSLHYVVVGGWLIHYVEKHRFIKYCLKRFDGIYVETTIMRQALNKMGFNNVILMPNFKRLKPIPTEQLIMCHELPFRFCTFSRVMKQKGIENAVNAIRDINMQFDRTVCTLDIYGNIDLNQTDWFNNLTSTFSPEIRYLGVIDYNQSTEILKDYFALLFPTEFYTEGVPGTIIDAYAAGVPVVASQWESFSDVVDHGSTGIGYPFENPEYLKNVLISLINNPEVVYSMKKNCLAKAYQYLPDNVIDVLVSKLL